MRIAVLHDAELPTTAWTADIPAALETHGATVELVSVDQIRNGLDADHICLPHGGAYPVEIEDALIGFFSNGGGLVHIGGTPFSRPMARDNDQWVDHERTLGDIRDNVGYGPLTEPLDVFPARLGLASYDLDLETTQSELIHEFDTRLIGSLSRPLPAPTVGLLMNTSMPLVAARPDLRMLDHRAYQARPLSRAHQHAGILRDPDGTKVGVSLLLTKFYANPYDVSGPTPRPWVIYAGQPEGPVPTDLIGPLLRWLQTPVFFDEPEVEHAAIHEGETTVARVRLRGELPDGWTVRARTAVMDLPELSGDQPTSWTSAPPSVSADGLIEVPLDFRAEALVRAAEIELVDDTGTTRDLVTTGTVCVREADLMRGPRIGSDGRYMKIETATSAQPSTFVVGANWHDRELFAFTWDHPNGLRLGRDAAEMARAGMQIVRPHFYHPGWFPATAADVYGKNWPELYSDFYDGPELSDKHMRAFEAHLAVFSAAEIAFNPTIYTSVGANMGDPGHWIGTSRLFVLDDLIENQLKFARQLMDRFGKYPGLIWDLDNEPDTALHDAGPWLERHLEVWGRTGHSVGVGTNWNIDSVRLGESADWHSVHGHIGPFPNKPAEFGSGKPCLFQESHNPGKATRDGNDEVEINLDRAVCWTLRYGGAGFLPWGWAMGLMNWRFGGGWVEYWDYELGVGVHADGTPRATLGRLQNWARVLEGLEFDQNPDRQIIFVYPKRFLAAMGIAEYIDILAPAGYRVRAINDSDLASADLDGARLIIFPHGAAGYCEESFTRMRAFAHDGGCVWAHNDTMLCDERGRIVNTRPIPKPGGREPIGSGFIHWSLGWNTDRNPHNAQLPINLIPLLPLVEELGVSPLGTTLPLVDGSITFSERHSTTELAMSSAWDSRIVLPPQDVVTAFEIRDAAGETLRAWSDGSEPIEIGKYRLNGNGTSVFAIRHDDAVYVAGRTITTDEGTLPESAELVRPFPDWRPTGERATITDRTIDLTGWRGRYWIRLGE